MNDLKGIIETEVEIKGCAEKFYNFKKKTPNKVPSVAGEHIKGVNLDGGDWDTYGHGSIKTWTYTIDGISGEFKERTEVDDKNKKLTNIGLGGDMFNEYKSFIIVNHFIHKDKEICLVKLTIEYEKLNLNVPAPTKYLNLLTAITKDIEAHFVQNQ